MYMYVYHYVLSSHLIRLLFWHVYLCICEWVQLIQTMFINTCQEKHNAASGDYSAG